MDQENGRSIFAFAQKVHLVSINQLEKWALPPNSKLYILITIYGPTQMRLQPDPMLEDFSNCMTNLHEKSKRLLQIMWCIFPVQHYSKNFRL